MAMHTMFVNGNSVGVDMSSTTDNPDTVYAAWKAAISATAGYTAYGNATGDDGAIFMQAASIWGGGNEGVVLSYEAGIEFSTDLNVTPTASISSNPAGVSRYYTMNSGNRIAIIYHPNGADSGLSSLDGGYLQNEIAVMKAVHNRVSENTTLYAQITENNGAVLYIKNAGNRDIAVYAVVYNDSNAVVGLVYSLGTITQGTTAKVLVSTIAGYVQGHVYDVAGSPASRVVRVYNRTSGAIVGSGTSDATTGEFSVPVIGEIGDVLYAIALDDDDAPDLNAIIADRITLS